MLRDRDSSLSVFFEEHLAREPPLMENHIVFDASCNRPDGFVTHARVNMGTWSGGFEYGTSLWDALTIFLRDPVRGQENQLAMKFPTVNFMRLTNGVEYMGYQVHLPGEEALIYLSFLTAFANGYAQIHPSGGPSGKNCYLRWATKPGVGFGLATQSAMSHGITVSTTLFDQYVQGGSGGATLCVYPLPRVLTFSPVKIAGNYPISIAARKFESEWNRLVRAEIEKAGAHSAKADELRKMICNESVFKNAKGELYEASGENIAVVMGKKVYTPGPEHGCLPGTTMATFILIMERLGYEIVRTPLTDEHLKAADWGVVTGNAATFLLWKAVVYPERGGEVIEVSKRNTEDFEKARDIYMGMLNGEERLDFPRIVEYGHAWVPQEKRAEMEAFGVRSREDPQQYRLPEPREFSVADGFRERSDKLKVLYGRLLRLPPRPVPQAPTAHLRPAKTT